MSRAPTRQQQAIFVVAHRINGVAEARALDAATHAIEVDARATADGEWRIDHDGAFPWSTRPAALAAALAPRALDVVVFNIKSPSHDVRPLLAPFDRALHCSTAFVIDAESLDALDALVARAILGDSRRRIAFSLFTTATDGATRRAAFARSDVAWFGIGVFSAWPWRGAYDRAALDALRARGNARRRRPLIGTWTLGTECQVADALDAQLDVLVVAPYLDAYARALVAANPALRLGTAADV